jgi:hypothetical protein
LLPDGSDQLKRQYNLAKYFVEIQLEDLASYKESLASAIRQRPADVLPLVGEKLAAVRAGASGTRV